MSDLMEMILVDIYYYALPVFYVAAAVFGILIFTGKTKSVRFLGLAAFVSALGNIGAKIMDLFKMASVEKAYKLVVPMNIAGLIIGLITTVCICIFIHKNYGKKYIYALILSIYLGTTVLGMIMPVVLSRFASSSGLKGEEMVYWIEMLNGISSFLLGSVNSIILIAVLFQNRKTEKVIPHYWLVRLITYIWSIITVVLSSAGWRLLIEAEDHTALFKAQDFRDLIQVSSGFLSALIALAVPLYIFVASKKAARLQYAGQEETV